MDRKVIIFCDKLFDRLIILASLLFFLVCAYAMYDAAMVYYNANDTSVLKFKPDLTNPEASVHGILQARILEWVAMPSSRGSFQPRN